MTAAWLWLKNFKIPANVVLIIVAVACIFSGCVCRTWRKAVIESEGPTFEEHAMGWVDKPDYSKQVIATFARPFFGDAGKNLIQGAEDKDALLYKVFEKVTGSPWQPHDQNGVGCCVGEGNSGAVELLSTLEIALSVGDPQEYKPISGAAIYALAREVGGDLGNQDGAVGADAAKALMQLGSISCEEAKDTNGRDGSAKTHSALAKRWGRTGLPQDLKAIAKTHLIKTASQVRTPEEVRAANTNGYVVTICSSVGFEGHGGFKRDKDGFCYPGGTWPHCMFIGGYRADKKAFLVYQSWGPTMPPGPKSLDQPDGTFWITWDACQRIVKSGECFALSSFAGYPARDLPFIIQAPLQRDFAIIVETTEPDKDGYYWMRRRPGTIAEAKKMLFPPWASFVP